MKMTKFNKLLLGYFLVGIPISLIGTLYFYNQNMPEAMPLGANPLMTSLAIVYLLMTSLWAITVLIFLGKLIFSTQFRESILKQLLFMKERDEREELISQKAAQSSFLFTMGVVLMLIFLNTGGALDSRGVQRVASKNSIEEESSSFNARIHAPGVNIFKSSRGDEKGEWMIKIGSENISTNEAEITSGASGSGSHKIYLILVLITQLASYFYFARKAEKVI